jgi:hypothetical protein
MITEQTMLALDYAVRCMFPDDVRQALYEQYLSEGREEKDAMLTSYIRASEFKRSDNLIEFFKYSDASDRTALLKLINQYTTMYTESKKDSPTL